MDGYALRICTIYHYRFIKSLNVFGAKSVNDLWNIHVEHEEIRQSKDRHHQCLLSSGSRGGGGQGPCPPPGLSKIGKKRWPLCAAAYISCFLPPPPSPKFLDPLLLLVCVIRSTVDIYKKIKPFGKFQCLKT